MLDATIAFHLFDEVDIAITEAEMYLDCMSLILQSLADTAQTIPYLQAYENAFAIIIAGLKRCCSSSSETTKRGFEEIRKAKAGASAS